MRKLFILIALNFITGSSIIMAQVDTAWVRTFDSGNDMIDIPTAMDIDNAGNIFVTGYSYPNIGSSDIVTLKYYSNGDTAWVRRYSSIGGFGGYPASLKADQQGNVYITGTVPGDYSLCKVLVKYLSNGDVAWYRIFGGRRVTPGGPFPDPVIAIGNSGNIYMAGNYGYVETPYDGLVAKYSPDGDSIWAQKYNAPENLYEGFNAIALDNSENIYVTGYVQAANERTDILTVKYDSSGQRLWVSRYNGQFNLDDEGDYIAADAAGNVYVAGSSKQINAYEDLTLIKYDLNGDTIWIRYHDGSAHSDDYIRGLAIDNAGNAIICGSSGELIGQRQIDNFVTIKYDSDGNNLWIRMFNESDAMSAIPNSMCTDADDDIYVTGFRGSNLLTVKYFPNGDTAWAWGYTGCISGKAVIVDSSMNVYLSGDSRDSGHSDITTIKLTQAPVKIENQSNPLPFSFRLLANHPNPFNAKTIIGYDLPNDAYVTLEIYDILGQKVGIWDEGHKNAGSYQVVWDGSGQSSGIYFYRLNAGDFNQTKRMMLLK